MTKKKDDRVDIRLGTYLSDKLRFEAEERNVTMQWLGLRLISEGLERLRPPEEFRLTEDSNKQIG